MAIVVFDLDGTLIDSAPDIRATANDVLSAMDAAPLDLAETISFIGNGAGVFVRKMREARHLPEAREAEMLRLFLDGYENAKDLTQLYSGVLDALKVLQGQGHALGLCTNKPEVPARAILKHMGLEPFFPAVIGGDSLPLRKPDPAPLLATCDALGDGPRIYVGDSEVDAETAQATGVPFAFFTQGYCHIPHASVTCVARFDHFDALAGIAARYAATAPDR